MKTYYEHRGEMAGNWRQPHNEDVLWAPRENGWKLVATGSRSEVMVTRRQGCKARRRGDYKAWRHDQYKARRHGNYKASWPLKGKAS